MIHSSLPPRHRDCCSRRLPVNGRRDPLNFLVVAVIFAVISRTALAQAAPPDQLGGFALLTGSYMAMAADCNLPTAPLEDAFDTILRNRGAASSEILRLNDVMMQSRMTFRGAARAYGCDEVQRRIDNLLHSSAR